MRNAEGAHVNRIEDGDERVEQQDESDEQVTRHDQRIQPSARLACYPFRIEYGQISRFVGQVQAAGTFAARRVDRCRKQFSVDHEIRLEKDVPHVPPI